MANEDINDKDFEDFGNEGIADIEMDSDLSDANEMKIEEALRNIASQMASSPESDQFGDISINNNQTQETSEEISEETSEKQEADFEEASEEQEKIDYHSSMFNDKAEKEPQEDQQEIKVQDVGSWGDSDDSDDIVKKYIVYISKDFIPIIGDLSTDERSAYINDAIQLKLDLQDKRKQASVKRSAFIHLIIAVVIFVALTPFALYITNKAILATFDNYKYSQDNFEKLYRHRFQKDRAYARSLQYNKELEKKLKGEKSEKGHKQ